MDKHLIIAIVGKKRSGKDTAGDYLEKEYGVRRSQKLAHPIKEIGKLMFGWTEEMVEGIGYDREQIIPELGFSVRRFLQEAGSLFKYDLGDRIDGWGRKQGPKIWANILVEWLNKQEKGFYFVTDVRFPEEVEVFKKHFDVIVLKCESDRSGQDSHVSETRMNDMDCDFKIINNGWNTFDDFYKSLDLFVEYVNDRTKLLIPYHKLSEKN